jgi:hypothetical protein
MDASVGDRRSIMTEPGIKNDEFVDLNGRQVHAFALQMANLGYTRMTDELMKMLRAGHWRNFQYGDGRFRFLPGEFDYFLTQQGVRREDVMKGVQDLDAKAELEAAMDERRTGEENYRRRIAEARADNPQRPGRPIEPFGVTKAEAKALLNDRADGYRPREALGKAARRWTLTSRATTRAPSETLPLVERLRRSALRLDDADLADLIDSLKQEQKRRRRGASTPTT